MCKIANANIVTAFDSNTIGTKVVAPDLFWPLLDKAIANHDPSGDRAPGQHFIVLQGANELVSQGVRERTDNPDDYCNRLYRGRVEQFMRRTVAASEGMVAAIVYTTEAYLNDPECEPEEKARIEAIGCDHVLVAVLAGPSLAMPLYRLASNLLGGNKEWDGLRENAKLTEEKLEELYEQEDDQICYKAKELLADLQAVLKAVEESKTGEDTYCVVAD